MEYGFCYVCVPLLLLIVGVLATPAVLGIREMLLGMGSRNRRRVAMGSALLAASMVLAALVSVKPAQSVRLCIQAPYSSPPEGFEPLDLVGTWETHYGRSVDKLTLKADGTFQQVYVDHYDEEYTFETDWNQWPVQRLSDGRVRVHLLGARFYQDGIHVAEEGGWGHGAGSFYDPLSVRPVDMDGKLILNVRVDPDGELILYHMWSTGDQGFAMTGCERDIFRRVEAP